MTQLSLKDAVFTVTAICSICVSQFASAQVNRQDPSQNADAIVVGDIASGLQSGSGSSLGLRVDRVLAGPVKSGEVLSILWDGPPPKRAAGVPGDFGLWLLRASIDGNWRIIPVPGSGNSLAEARYPVPMAPPSSPANSGATPLDLIIAELANAAAAFDPGGMEFHLTANGLLRLPPTPSLTTAFRSMSQAANFELRALGLTGLIYQGDVTALHQVTLDINEYSQSHVRADMAGAVSTVRDPTTIADLGWLATTQSVGFGMQIRAAEALAKIHTKESLRFLATLLDSSNIELRNYAFDGFTRFVMNLPIEMPAMVTTMAWMKPQGPSPYRNADTDGHIGSYRTPADKQAEYVAFWKAWWAQHGELH